MAQKSPVSLPPIMHVRPPASTDQVAPPIANQVRVVTTGDAVIIHAYYVNPTAIEAAAEGREQPHIKIEGDTAYVEVEPVARIALPLSVAGDLLGLLARNLAYLGPKVGPHVASQLKSAAEEALASSAPDDNEKAKS